MPDIKRNFTRGKMNKDLDERLVPDGEYRDAMNVQVSTSEDSDIGVIQNLLGNEKINVGALQLPNNAVCVGSVVNNSDNSVYWFVTSNDDNTPTSMILEYKNNLISPVLVTKGIPAIDKNGLAPANINDLTDGNDTITINDNFLQSHDINLAEVYVTSGGVGSYPETGALLSLNTYDGVDLVEGLNIRVRLLGQNTTTTPQGVYRLMYLTNPIPLNLFPNNDISILKNISFFNNTVFSDKNDVVVFDPNTHITGINIIDGMLMWTQGTGEPKKINIDRCKQGTIPTGLLPTRLVNDQDLFSTDVTSRFSHDNATVIKKRPSNGLSLIPTFSRDPEKTYSGIFNISADSNISNIVSPANTQINNLSIGQEFTIEVVQDSDNNSDFTLSYNVGDLVNIAAYEEDGLGNQIQPSLPLSTYQISGTIVNSINNNYQNNFSASTGAVPQSCYITIKVDYIDSNSLITPGTNLEWSYIIDKNIQESKLFDNKFVRFAYRYNFLDQQKSAFSNFSEPAFVPGPYNFSVEKGYNLSMVNTIDSVKLIDFRSATTPNDVFSIDILSKDDFSTAVRLVDTITKPFSILPSSSFNPISLDVDYTFGTDITYDQDYLEFTGGPLQTVTSNLPTMEVGKTYSVMFEITDYIIGEIRFNIVDQNGQIRYGNFVSGNGEKTFTFILEPTLPNQAPQSPVNSLQLESSNTPEFQGRIQKFILTEGKSNWIDNSITISSQGQGAILPSNQLLRVFDNVPTNAKSQEIIGNRLVYGNYTDGMDIVEPIGIKYKPELNVSLVNETIKTVMKSVKSLREYQVGVSFLDKQKRESPVISSAENVSKLDIDRSSLSNKLAVSINNYDVPEIADYFKFYIKETSDQYYNLILYKIYRAEDVYNREAPNVAWLSFNSSDRNKVQEEDYLVLKKGVNDFGAVTKPNKYKVLAIANEAPRIVRTTISKVTEILNSGQSLFGTSTADIPIKGFKSFEVDYEKVHNTPAGNMHEQNSGLSGIRYHCYFEFNGAETNTYEISSIHTTWDGFDTASLIGSKYKISVKKSFGPDVDFLLNSSDQIKDNVKMHIYKHEERGKEEFDGKFFVKVQLDEIFNESSKVEVPAGQEALKVVASKNVYSTQYFDNGVGVEGELENIQIFNPTVSMSGIFGTVTSSLGPERWSTIDLRKKFLHMSYFTDFYPVDVPNTQVASGIITNVGQTIDDGFINVDAAGQNSNQKPTDPNKRLPFNIDLAESQDELVGYIMYNPDGSIGEAPDEGVWYLRNLENVVDLTGWKRTMWGDQHLGWMSSNVYDESSYELHDGKNNGQQQRPPKPPTETNFHNVTTLGFGGLFSKEWSFNDGNVSYDPIPGFFDIVNGGNPNHQGENNFAQKIYPSSRYRWKEDSLGTIFTITETTPYQSMMYAAPNHRRHDFYFVGDTTPGNAQKKIILDNWPGHKRTFDAIGVWEDSPFDSSTTPYQTENIVLENMPFQKYFSHFFQTGIGNITSNPFPYGAYIKTINGTSYSWPAVDWGTNPDNFQFHDDGDPRLTSWLTDTFYTHPANWTKNWYIKYDPSINSSSRFNPKHPSIGGHPSLVAGGFTMSLTATGGFNNSGSVGVLDDLHLEVTSITGTNSLTNESQDLHVGMALTHINNAQLPGQILVVKEIVEVSPTLFKIYLAGWSSVVKLTDLTTNPSNGQALKFGQPLMNGISPQAARNYQALLGYAGQTRIYPVSYVLQFIDDEDLDNDEFVYEKAVLETEPKEIPEVDIYYETGQSFPMVLNHFNYKDILRLGGKCTLPSLSAFQNQRIRAIKAPNIIYLGNSVSAQAAYNISQVGDKISFEMVDGTLIETVIEAKIPVGKGIIIPKQLYKATFTLPWYNCWSFGNGVESNRIRDNFNEPFLANGVRVNAASENLLTKKERKNTLIYSGIYNQENKINNLNEFNQAEKITKETSPAYGSIQKLYSRDSDLIAFCEDKVLKILANKDALFNADGNPQLIATPNVLGQVVPFVGDYGISKNPESFAAEGFRSYFTDANRSKVLRLSRDGLTPISDAGMKSWFNNYLTKDTVSAKGSYDIKKRNYNLTIEKPGFLRTLSFSEDVKGWTSFKSFIPESGISLGSDYYTFKYGCIYEHDKNENRNTFYDVYAPTTLKTVVNDLPSVIKSFSTINYEGSQSKINDVIDYDTVVLGNIVTGTYLQGDYYNLQPKTGWFVQSVKTDLEKGSLEEFIKKEGKWYNYIRGENIVTNNSNQIVSGYDVSSFDVQGIGVIEEEPIIGSVFGCTDDTMILHTGWAGDEEFNKYVNYDPTAAVDDGSCVLAVVGCMDAAANNFDPAANTNYGCQYWGCTDPTAFNYNPNANYDDGTCIPVILGCTDSSTFVGQFYVYINVLPSNQYNQTPSQSIPKNYYVKYNYDPTANTDDGSCVDTILGCTNPAATNFIPLVNDPAIDVNTDDGSCEIPTYECVNTLGPPQTSGNIYIACNSWFYQTNGQGGLYPYNYQTMLSGTIYNQIIDDGSCEYCSDPTAVNYDGADPVECAATQIAAGNPGYTVGTSACIYYPCTINMLLGTTGFRGATYLGISTTTNNCTGINQSTGTQNLAPDFYEIEYQQQVTANVWDSSSGAIATFTYDPTGGPDLPPNSPGDFDITGLSPCTAYTARIRGVSNQFGATIYTPWSTDSSVTDCSGPGCTDNTGASNPIGAWQACNYESWATTDDGSCEYTSCAGCSDPLYLEFCNTCWVPASGANLGYAVTDGSGGPWIGSDQTQCLTLGAYGCTDPLAYNYDPLATVNQISASNTNSPCEKHKYGCLASFSTADDYTTPGSGVNNYNITANTACSDAVGVFDFVLNAYVPALPTSPTAGQEGYEAFDGGASASTTLFGPSGSNVIHGDCCEYGDCAHLRDNLNITFTATSMKVTADVSKQAAAAPGTQVTWATYKVTVVAPDGTTLSAPIRQGSSNQTSYVPASTADTGNTSHIPYFQNNSGGLQTNPFRNIFTNIPSLAQGQNLTGDWTVKIDNGYPTYSDFNYYTCGELTCPTVFNLPYGCTDALALNYDAAAIFDDGSCNYPQFCVDYTPTNRGYGLTTGWGFGPGADLFPSLAQKQGLAATNFSTYPAPTSPLNSASCQWTPPTIEPYIINGTLNGTYEIANVVDRTDGVYRPVMFFKINVLESPAWPTGNWSVTQARTQFRVGGSQSGTSNQPFGAGALTSTVASNLYSLVQIGSSSNYIFHTNSPQITNSTNYPLELVDTSTATLDPYENVYIYVKLRIEHTGDPDNNVWEIEYENQSLNLYSNSTTLTKIGCTDVDAPGYDSTAGLPQNDAVYGADEDAFTACNYNSSRGCTSYWSLNKISSSLVSPFHRDGDPRDCFYGDPVDLSTFNLSFDTANNGYQRIIFSRMGSASQGFDNNLIDSSGNDYAAKATFDTAASTEPLYVVSGIYKLPGDTGWRTATPSNFNMMLSVPHSASNSYLLGVYKDGSTGNNWSDKPFVFVNTSLARSGTDFCAVDNTNAQGYSVISGTVFRFQIRQMSNDTITGNNNAAGHEPRAGKQRFSKDGIILQEYSADLSAGQSNNIWSANAAQNSYSYGLPYLEITIP